jgi:protease-4
VPLAGPVICQAPPGQASRKVDRMAEFMLQDKITRVRQRRTAPLILELDLTEGLADEPPADPVSALLTMRRPRLAEVLDGLRRAATDDRVRALVVKVGGRPIGLARVQELRAAVREFARSGKATVAWAETFGEFGPGNVPYYLATAFGRIYLQPSGDLGLTGISIQQLFFRDAMDKLGLEYQVGKRHEYKNAADRLTEHGFTGPAREAMERLAVSLTGQLAEAVGERLKITAGQAMDLIDRGPFLAADALAAGLVDAVGYRDEVYADVRKQATGGGHGPTGHGPSGGPGAPEPYLLYLGRYQRSRALTDRARKLPSPAQDSVALIYATGPIRRGRSGRGPGAGGSMGSDTIAAALRSAAADHRVKAIVLRINSPGGSYVASDTIRREVVQARRAGTPVLASMADVAASGGYFIAMAADAIVAQPATLTGSIGVLVGKPVTTSLFEHVGVTTDAVTQGRHADMFTATRPFSDEEWELVNSWLDQIYADFTGKVAHDRKLPADQVHQIARGRVWTGADAASNGLVDHLGGLETAAKLARAAAGLPATAPLRLYPRAHPLDRLRPPESSEDRAAARARLFAESWGPLWRLAASTGLPPFGPLQLPGSWTIR